VGGNNERTPKGPATQVQWYGHQYFHVEHLEKVELAHILKTRFNDQIGMAGMTKDDAQIHGVKICF